MKIEDIEEEMNEWNPSWRGEDMAVWAEKYGKKLLAVAKAAKELVDCNIYQAEPEPHVALINAIEELEK